MSYKLIIGNLSDFLLNSVSPVFKYNGYSPFTVRRWSYSRSPVLSSSSVGVNIEILTVHEITISGRESLSKSGIGLSEGIRISPSLQDLSELR